MHVVVDCDEWGGQGRRRVTNLQPNTPWGGRLATRRSGPQTTNLLPPSSPLLSLPACLHPCSHPSPSQQGHSMHAHRNTAQDGSVVKLSKNFFY